MKLLLSKKTMVFVPIVLHAMCQNLSLDTKSPPLHEKALPQSLNKKKKHDSMQEKSINNCNRDTQREHEIQAHNSAQLHIMAVEIDRIKALQNVLQYVLQNTDEKKIEAAFKARISQCLDSAKKARQFIILGDTDSYQIKYVLELFDRYPSPMQEVSRAKIQDEQCVICYSDLKKTSETTGHVVELRCSGKHQFHQGCIEKYFLYDSKCPFDRINPSMYELNNISYFLALEGYCVSRKEIRNYVEYEVLRKYPIADLIFKTKDYYYGHYTADNFIQGMLTAIL